MHNIWVDKKHNLGIRPFAVGDALAYYEAAIESVPAAYQFMPWCHPEYSLAEAQWWIESQIQLWQQNESFGFITYDLNTNGLIGAIEVARFDHAENCADLGYWMRTSQTGKGSTTAAAFLAANFAFTQLQLNYLRVYCLPENTASRRVAEKLGATFIEEIPDFVYMHGQMRSSIYYQLTPENFFAALKRKQIAEMTWWEKIKHSIFVKN